MDPVFTPEEVMQIRKGSAVLKLDKKSGRTLVCESAYFGGHILIVRGPGVPGDLTIHCESEVVNILAKVLLSATYDGSLWIDTVLHRAQGPFVP